eukprot:10909369-Alexandrium_andersonii.AAC.1
MGAALPGRGAATSPCRAAAAILQPPVALVCRHHWRLELQGTVCDVHGAAGSQTQHNSYMGLRGQHLCRAVSTCVLRM